MAPRPELPYPIDREIEQKLYEAMFKAVIEACSIEGGKIVHFRTNEVMSATVKMQATMLATSPDAMSAKELKYWSRTYEKELRRLTLLFKAEYLKSGFPFGTVSPDTEGHA